MSKSKLSEKLAGLGAACDALSCPVDVDGLADEAAALEARVAELETKVLYAAEGSHEEAYLLGKARRVLGSRESTV